MAKKPCTHNPLRFYCDSLLSSRHEHDHFPRPRYLDGTDVVPACLNCHDLKDWQPLKNWDPDTYDFETLFTSMPPLAADQYTKFAAQLIYRRNEEPPEWFDASWEPAE